MPNRILKESICTSETIASLTPEREVLFYRLIVQCDDYGRMDARPAIVRAKCFPLQLNRVTEADIEQGLTELEQAGLIRLYALDDKCYLQMVTWHKHQNVRAKRSKYPAPVSDLKAPSSACVHMQADDYNCKHTQTDDCNCKQVQADDGTCARNPNPNPNPYDRQTARAREGWGAVVEAYFGWCGGTLGGLHAETLGEYYDKLGAEMVVKAFTLAKEKDARQFSYIEKILAGWVHRGILTLDDWERDEKQFQEAKQSKSRQTEPTGRYIPGVEATRKYLEEQRRQFEGGAASG
jgi:DnaD/phage-associated family protein